MAYHDEEHDDPMLVRAVEKAFRVLETFDALHSRQTLTQLAQRAGIDRSAAQRFAHTLLYLGYLQKVPNAKTYELSAKSLNMGYRYTRSSQLVQRAHPYLMHLNRSTGETISLTLRDDTDIIYLARYLSTNTLDNDVIVGSKLPAYCSAAGLVFLAGLQDDQINDILARSDLRAYTPKTIFEPEQIWQRIYETRQRGFAIAVEQVYANDIALAAPIHLPDGHTTAAVVLAASNLRYDENTITRQFVPMMISATRSVTQILS
ncbi:IclR family transcriptional regulator [Ochrobactrum sp. MYb379]|uniref:IclR family transcriptional regulator n=1 Tax=Ochrobactrum sp. MYb379 TaxID=2745275 RepID=UPI0030B2BA1A